MAGNGHGNQVNGIRSFGDLAYTCGIDDSLREINVEGNAYTDGTVKLNSQPRGLDIFREQNIVVLACQKEITVVQVGRSFISDHFGTTLTFCVCVCCDTGQTRRQQSIDSVRS